MKQGIQSNSWLAVLGDGKLKDNKLETMNNERQLVRCGLWWHVTGLQPVKKGILTERWLGGVVGGTLWVVQTGIKDTD